MQVQEKKSVMWAILCEDLLRSILHQLDRFELARLAAASKDMHESVKVYTAACQDSLMAVAEPIFGPDIITRLAHVLGRPVDMPPPCEEESLPEIPPDPDRPGFYLRRDGTMSRGGPLTCGATAIHVHYFEHPRTGANCVIWIAGVYAGSVLLSRSDVTGQLVVDVLTVSHPSEVVGLLLCALNLPLGSWGLVANGAPVQPREQPITCLAPSPSSGMQPPSWGMRSSPSPRDAVSLAEEQGHLAAGILLVWQFLGCTRVAVNIEEDRLRLQCFVAG
jgi:hypothetical protein